MCIAVAVLAIFNVTWYYLVGADFWIWCLPM